MISVQQATDIVLQEARSFGTERVSFAQSLGRILAEDILADTDLPPFHRVMMDGIAIRKSDFDNGNRLFKIQEMQRAGEAAKTLSPSNYAIEIMTGGVLPIGADAVIPYEQIELKDNTAFIQTDDVKHFQNIHAQGSDKKKHDVLVKKDTRICAAEIGIAASVGHTSLLVHKFPRIHIFSTGDELVEPSATPLAHQIRRSNVYSLAALLKSFGIEATLSHITDEYESIVLALKNALQQNDIVLLTGGVSKGKYDLIPQAMEDCGVKKLFHRISQRPGKPMWFGKSENTTVFAFPGNPVSTFMCAVRYLFPYLRKSFHQPPFTELHLKLAEDFKPHLSLTFFLQVKMHINENGNAWAVPFKGNGSGDYSNLTEADAFVEIPASENICKKGTAVKAFLFRGFL